MRLSPPALSLIGALALAACGGAEPTATTPAAAAPAATAAATAAAPVAAAPSAAPAPAAPAAAPVPATTGQVAFSTMSKDQQFQHMKAVIRPQMGKLFQDYDAKAYGDFGCGTCHGANKEDTHKALPKLTLSGNGFQKLSTEKPAVMKFMAEKVTPTMASWMGEKPFDPATHQGFGCGGCHSVQ
jgi:hypothetical protein